MVRSLTERGTRHPVYYVMRPPRQFNLARFDGVRYGHRAKNYVEPHRHDQEVRAEGFGAEAKRRILVGTYVLSHGYTDAYFIHGDEGRRLNRE